MAWNSFEKMLVFSSMLDSSLRRSRERAEIDALHRENERMTHELEQARLRREREEQEHDVLKAAGLDIRDYESPQMYFDRLSQESRDVLGEKADLDPCGAQWRMLNDRWEELDRKKTLYLKTLYPDLRIP